MRILALFFFIQTISSKAQSLSDKIKVNQNGYLKGHTKIGWLSNSQSSYQNNWWVKQSSSGNIVYTSSFAQHAVYDASSGDTVYKMDFSQLNTAGSYYLEVQNVGLSYTFTIDDTTYNKLFVDLARSYYYQRCGEDLTPTYAGTWSRIACHDHDGYLYNGYSGGNIVTGNHVASSGGWHDAGDFGKKIVPASMALYHLLKLVELFPSTVNNISLQIPQDTFAMPDILKEAKVELDWFFTLQFANGSVSHLLTSANFYLGMPENDTQTRYLVHASSAATADFAAVMAIAAKVYEPYHPSYASLCLTASQNAWAYLQANPSNVPVGGYTADPPGINGTGQYLDDNDLDERLWAAAELFNTTLNATYRNYFESNYSHWNPAISYPESWSDVHGHGMFTYCMATANEQTNSIRNSIINDITHYANSTINAIHTTGYGLALTPADYYWGSNQLVGEYGVDLIRAHLLQPDTSYLEAALSHLNYLLGSNALNVCFVTGHGTHGTKDPWQAPMVYDGIALPIPGFVPGGPNQFGGDPTLDSYISAHHSNPARCYLDDHNSYSGNEVCLTYTAPLLFLVSYFYNPNKGTTTGITNDLVTTDHPVLKAYPNPLIKSTTVAFTLNQATYVTLDILDNKGEMVKQLLKENKAAGQYTIDLSLDLPKGIYQCRLLTSFGIKTVTLIAN